MRGAGSFIAISCAPMQAKTLPGRFLTSFRGYSDKGSVIKELPKGFLAQQAIKLELKLKQQEVSYEDIIALPQDEYKNERTGELGGPKGHEPTRFGFA